MNILILGSGGREHVFAKKISESPLCDQLFIAPGNAGTALCGENLNFAVTDFQNIKAVCLDKKIDLILPGGEDSLVAGIADFIKADAQLNHILVAGPSKAGAMIEGSKDFSKIFMQKYNVPTAAYQTFTNTSITEGQAFLSTLKPPFVLKADGLAAGKGVLIIDDLKEAQESLAEMLNGKFGKASDKVVVEEFLDGIEMSCFVLSDGTNYVILPEAKDYKRIGEGDKGLNTGGMGAVSPVPFANAEFLSKVETKVIVPTVNGLKAEGIDYRGFIFIGLMKVGNEPYVIEYNCRMGDPETEVVLHRVENDLVELLKATCTGDLKNIKMQISAATATTVFLVSGGYPEAFEKGFEITHIDAVNDTTVYHAGTKNEGGKVVTNGGRVIALTSTGNNMKEAIAKSMQAAELIQYTNKYYRKDIAQDLIHYNEHI
jgi:phosphoribosylamine--glycine ligase